MISKDEIKVRWKKQKNGDYVASATLELNIEKIIIKQSVERSKFLSKAFILANENDVREAILDYIYHTHRHQMSLLISMLDNESFRAYEESVVKKIP